MSDADFLSVQTALAGRYSLERELGRGGMGVVYLAREVALDRPVALKRLPLDCRAPDLSSHDRRRLGRFVDEAEIMARLEHPGVLPVYEIAIDGKGRPFFTMPLVCRCCAPSRNSKRTACSCSPRSAASAAAAP